MIAADGDHAIKRSQQGHAIAKGIQCADLDQALEAALTDRAQVHPAGEVVEVLEGAILLPFFQHNFHGALAEVLDGTQPKADGRLIIDVFDLEIPTRGIDLGRKNGHSHGAGVGHI